MDKKLLKLLIQTEEKLNELEALQKKVTVELNRLCDFDAACEKTASDGLMVANYDEDTLARFTCMIDVTEDNKLTEEEHEKHCI